MSGSRMVPYGSVDQSYTDTGQSSDLSGLVGSSRAKSGFGRVSVGTLFWHNGTRQAPTGRSTVPCRCTIGVRTLWARHGVPTGSPGPRRDPTDPRRTPSGTVGPGLIGASPVWAARHSYWRQPVYLYCSWEASPPSDTPSSSRPLSQPPRLCTGQGTP